jgi:N-acetylglucosamine-6-phosphate deacetylase
MASLYPVRCLGIEMTRGHLGRGAVADLVHIDDSATVRFVWIAGIRRAAP